MVALNVEQTKKQKCATMIVGMIVSGDLGPTMAASFLAVLLKVLLPKIDRDKLAKFNISLSTVEQCALGILPVTKEPVQISPTCLPVVQAVLKSLGVIGLPALSPAVMVAHDDELAM
jgi:hypothetical protein